jgi:hypothetical protein
MRAVPCRALFCSFVGEAQGGDAEYCSNVSDEKTSWMLQRVAADGSRDVLC